MPINDNKPTSGFLRFGRREQYVLLSSILLVLFGALIWTIFSHDWESSLKVISPLIITLGVVIALKNLQSTEDARRIDKDREDSKFHYEIGISLIERLENVLILQLKPDLLGEGKSFSPYSIGKALPIIETLRDVHERTLDTHSKALRREMDFLRDKLKATLTGIRVGDVCSLANTGTYNTPFPELVEQHNKYMDNLQGSNPQAFANNGPIDEDSPFPESVPCIDLCRFVTFLVDDADSFSVNRIPTIEQTLRDSERFGFKAVGEYLVLCQNYRNDNMKLKADNEEDLMFITS